MEAFGPFDGLASMLASPEELDKGQKRLGEYLVNAKDTAAGCEGATGRQCTNASIKARRFVQL